MSLSPPLLTTRRLQLRPCTVSDVDELHRFWTVPGVRKYLWDNFVISREQAAEVVTSSIYNFAAHGLGHWVVTFKDESELIGWCGLRHFGEPSAIEALYGVRPQFWGQGLAVEATLAVLHYGFETLELKHIFAGTDPPNTASIRVMEKIGMHFDRRTEIRGQEAIYYVLAREEFQSANWASFL